MPAWIGGSKQLKPNDKSDVYTMVPVQVKTNEDLVRSTKFSKDIVNSERHLHLWKCFGSLLCSVVFVLIGTMISNSVDAEEHELVDLGEPANYKAELSNPKPDKWLEVMNADMQSMIDNQVWSLVDLTPDGRTVGSKWLFKKKTDIDGNVHTYKTRLAAKGYTQTYGIDYEETFSIVADIKAIRILIAITAFYNREIWQMDVKTAFLNGHLNEDVYMVQRGL
ncbi:putative retrotransposon ty1-copia subclass protein [Tanacetum coccineum]|uniref:Retrotransposon ty1-copia subclass protein n=1 Tax=Tanacetum coccineum TaxID=301880 RepID=A0ABQ4ZFT6_9ASTR